MVVGVKSLDDDTWVLVAKGQDGALSDLAVEAIPDPVAARREVPEGFRPLALRFEPASRIDECAPSCTCLVATRRGPARIKISMPAALALVAAGRHGIVATPAQAASRRCGTSGRA